MHRKTLTWLIPSLAALALPAAVHAQAWPTRPVRILTAGAGGASDLSSRLIAQAIGPRLGENVIVDNRPGIISIETAAKSPPDGYTLLYYGTVIWNEPLLHPGVSWDALRDFAPVIQTVSAPNVLTVHPSLPIKSVGQLIALAKARPDELNVAAAATGSSTHLAAELFKYMAKVKIETIIYKATIPAFSDLMSGRVQLMFASPFSVAEFVRAGKLRAVAVTSPEPSPLAPGLPTVAATGVPGYQAQTVEGVFAPAKTPEPIIARLNQEITRFLQQPDVKERYFKSGVQVDAGSPEKMTAIMRADVERLTALIKATGLRAD
jgi:tripartite-type tricarboxylate transporter receptor subunit TctC